jgi:GT2 family glycosyltransferase
LTPTSVNPTVTLIIPVHRGGPAFARCLESLAAADPPPDELLVVADGDPNGEVSVPPALGARVLRTEEARGPARARNLGAREATGDVLFFVDADVTIQPDAVRRMAAEFAADPGLAALIGSYDDAPSEPNFLSQYKNLLHHWVHQQGHEEASTFWGACGAIRRDVFLAHGGFDESYVRPCIEDIELGYRLRAAGERIRLVKDLQVKHLKRWTVASLLEADFFLRAVPWTRLILTSGRFIDDLNLRTSSRVCVASALALPAVVAATVVAGAVLPAVWFAIGVTLSLALLAIPLWINRDVYAFFRRRRGIAFSLGTVPWHWFYFFYSGVAFFVGYCSVKKGAIPARSRGGRP